MATTTDTASAPATQNEQTPAAVPAPAQPEAQQPGVAQLPNHKVKLKKHLQRSCNEKDEKGKICGGHLKHWFYLTDIVEQKCGDVERAWGRNAEVYRCEYCKTLYLPNAEEPKVNVAGIGMQSVFGLTVAPKEAVKNVPVGSAAAATVKQEPKDAPKQTSATPTPDPAK